MKPKAKPPQKTPPGRPTHWHEVAQWYDQLMGGEGSEFHQRVIFPGVLKLLGLAEGAADKKKPRLLDVACGQGAGARMLARFADVTAVDAAPALIEAAQGRQKADNLGIHYIVADAIKLPVGAPELPPASFDAATLILAVQNISPLSPMWKGIHALLKPGGALVIVMMHPAFRVPKLSGWHWDDQRSRQARTVEQYLTSTRIEIQTHPGLAAHGKSEATTPHFHRPLHAYVNTLGAAGLLVDHLEEWASHKKSQPGPRQMELDRSRNEIPMFMALRARRM